MGKLLEVISKLHLSIQQYCEQNIASIKNMDFSWTIHEQFLMIQFAIGMAKNVKKNAANLIKQ